MASAREPGPHPLRLPRPSDGLHSELRWSQAGGGVNVALGKGSYKP